MLKGEKVLLRARHDSDIPVFEDELYADVETWSRADNRPWRPIPPGSADSPFRRGAEDDRTASFSVVELASDNLAGEALLWAIDMHNRAAHIGLSLRPSFRGKGLATDAVSVLCRYAFITRGLHRLQAETLADNYAMINVAKRNGFVEEGLFRRSEWVNGQFSDLVILGLLAEEWH
jgi:RimJ/RimL family protein N-acetyltransferase